MIAAAVQVTQSPLILPERGVIFLRVLLSVVVCVTGAFSAWYIQTYSAGDSGWRILWLLPLTYSVVFLLVLQRFLFRSASLFLWLFTLLGGVRYQILPFLIVASEYYDGRSAFPPDPENIHRALVLMCYEFPVYGLVITLLERLRVGRRRLGLEKAFQIPQSIAGYLIFLMGTAVLAILFPHSLSCLSFIKPVVRSSTELGFSGTAQHLVVYCLFTAKYVVFLLGVVAIYKIWRRTSSGIFRWMALIWLALNMTIVFGTNRTDFLLPAVSMLFLYHLLFQDRNYLKSVLPAFLIVFIFSVLTANREYASISKGQSALLDMTSTVSSYTGGPENVAFSLETKEDYPEVSDCKHLLFDIARPCIGINIFFKNSDIILTNYYFNYRIYQRDHVSQILPIVGQGYIFFGAVFAPLLGCLIICLAYFLEDFLAATNSPGWFFFVSLCVLRLGFFMGQNTNNVVNELSMNLLLFGLLYWGNQFVFCHKPKPRQTRRDETVCRTEKEQS